jgi:hypothetical protein
VRGPAGGCRYGTRLLDETVLVRDTHLPGGEGVLDLGLGEGLRLHHSP